jgi:hypothetical protein
MPVYRFGLSDVKVATWTAANSYGAAVDVNAAQMFEVTLETVSAELTGDDHIVDAHSKVSGVTVRLRNGDLDPDVLAIISGESNASSGTYDKIVFGETNRPYFALCGKVLDTGSGADTHFFIPKCKVMGNITFRMEYGSYVVPELEIKGVYEGAANGFAMRKDYATAAVVAIPPA